MKGLLSLVRQSGRGSALTGCDLEEEEKERGGAQESRVNVRIYVSMEDSFCQRKHDSLCHEVKVFSATFSLFSYTQ